MKNHLLSPTSWLKRPKAVLISGDHVASPHMTLAAQMINLALPNLNTKKMFIFTFFTKLFFLRFCRNIFVFVFDKNYLAKLYLVNFIWWNLIWRTSFGETSFGETSFGVDWLRQSIPWLCQVLHWLRQWY